MALLQTKAARDAVPSGRRAAQVSPGDVSTASPESALGLDREEIICGSAHELFSRVGLGVPLSEIARVAGVGVATLYRRHSDKDVLILEVYRRHLEDRVNFAVEANRLPEPWLGIEYFLRETSAQLAGDRGMRELVLGGYVGSAGWARGSAHQELLAALDAMDASIAPQLELLVNRARSAAVVRSDFQPADLMLMTAMVHSAVPSGTPQRTDLSQRALLLLIEGIRAPLAK